MKSIQCIENSKIYKSAKEASQDLHIDVSSIGKVCKGKLKQAGGYHFQFIEKMENGNIENGNVEKVENGKVEKVENGKVELTPDHLEKFRNVLTQPTIDLLSYTNMELINALANDILDYRERVKNELRKMAGAKNNVVNNQPQQENDGWDDYERELEEQKKENNNNPVMVEKEQPKQPQPKNPYLQDEEEECWDFIDDKEEGEYRAWKKEHLDLFTEREQREFLEEEKEEEKPHLTLEERRKMWTNWTETGTLDGHKEEPPKQEAPAENPIIEDEPKQEPSPQEKDITKNDEKDDLSEEDMAWEEDFANHPQWNVV